MLRYDKAGAGAIAISTMRTAAKLGCRGARRARRESELRLTTTAHCESRQSGAEHHERHGLGCRDLRNQRFDVAGKPEVVERNGVATQVTCEGDDELLRQVGVLECGAAQRKRTYGRGKLAVGEVEDFVCATPLKLTPI